MKNFKKFYQLISPFWFNYREWFSWILLSFLVALSLGIVWISVQYNTWSRAFYDALTNYFNNVSITSLALSYGVYTALFVMFVISSNWLKKLLIIRWRNKMTIKFESDWLRRSNHYRLSLVEEPDNPDQRIAEDIRLLIEQSFELFLSLLKNTTSLFSFIIILWDLSGTLEFELFDYGMQIKGYLVWIALCYAIFSSVIAHWIGHPLHKLNMDKQKTEADYRAALISVRENTEQIAFYNGERAELRRIHKNFSSIVCNWRKLMSRELKVDSFITSYFRLSLMIPIFAVLPIYMGKQISLGGVMQARSAFGYVLDAFGWFIDYYRKIVVWSATVERLWIFQQSLKDLPERNTPQRQANTIECNDLIAHHPGGKSLFKPVNFSLKSGQWLAVTGASGCGKTTLLRTLSGLWPYNSGQWKLPEGKSFFVPQKPYLPHDKLVRVLTYPENKNQSLKSIHSCLRQVGLSHLCSQLDDTKVWSRILSGGEQQRLSFARILLNQPRLICLDEATSNLDDKTAVLLLQHLRETLPDSIIIAISHQMNVLDIFTTKVNVVSAECRNIS